VSADHLMGDGRLLMALAEQLKVPLMQIARQVELDSVGDLPSKQIISTTEIALQLIDGYILGNSIKEQSSLDLQPVSMSAVMHEVKESLRGHAKNYDCNIELDIAGKYVPVMGDYKAFKSAFTSLGYTYIESQSQANSTIYLSVYSSKDKIIAGVFDENRDINADSLVRARALYGDARQPMPAKSASSSAGVYIADSIFSALSSGLKVAKHNNHNGLATTLIPSRQLKLV
jgi:light-regulated signal transduction histidine kinase (bacteriophytochrome)